MNYLIVYLIIKITFSGWFHLFLTFYICYSIEYFHAVIKVSKECFSQREKANQTQSALALDTLGEQC